MKRKSLLIVILLCLLTPWAARAQLVLFSEDFNSPVAGSQFLPTGWYNEGGGNSWQATQYNPSPSEGSYCVFASQDSPRGVKLVRTLPAFPSGITSAQLSFKHIHPVRDNYYVDVLNVYCRTTGSSAWNLIGYFQVSGYNDFANWTLGELNLPVNATAIAFEVANTSNGGGVGIDDLAIVCTNCPCPVPTNLTATFTSSESSTSDAVSATLNWTGYSENYNVRYRTAGSDAWTESTVSTNSLALHNLARGTTFEWQVQAVCGIDYESEWSILSSFTTPPPCTTPTDISVADITTASAVVSWQGTSDAYNLKYRRLPVSTDATVVLTVGDVWEDDTGYQMLLDSDATAYGNIIPEVGPFNREGDVSDEIYSQFEYKIPENADGSLTTQNIVLNSSVSITIPAGTYDWCITNPSPGDQMWIASENGNVGGRQNDYQFEGGKVYEFTVTLGDYGNDRVDVNITTVAPSSGSVTEDEPWTLVENVTSPYTINGLVDGTMYEVEVQAVCDDGNNSQWCHSIFTTPSACAVPTALSSTDILSDGATLSWTGYQEGYNIRYRTAGESAVPFFEDFEGTISDGWGIIDADGDGENWHLGYYGDGHSGNYAMGSESWNQNDGAFDPDNWLITPQLPLIGTMKVWVRSYRSSYPDNFAIYLSTTGNNVADFTTTLINETTAPYEYTEYTADLSSYNGQLGYIAIRHFDCPDQYALLVDDFGIYNDNPIPAGEWQTVTVTDNTLDIDGLTASTLYEWQVQGTNCDGNGGATEWSESAFFTTALPVVNVLADQWYAIAVPSHDDGETTLGVANVTGLLDADYDLFRYNEADGTWENQKASDGTAEGFSSFDPGRGYIYRRTTDATLIFNGISNSDNYSYTLTGSCLDNNLKGFNLIGNPYPHAVYKGVAFPADNLTTGYYSLEPNGTWLAHQDSDPIGIGQGVLVQMSGEGQAVLPFSNNNSAPTEGAKSTGNKGLQFSLTGLGYTDVAYALFARGEGLRKVSHLNSGAPTLSIPQESTDYAIANLDGTTDAFPLKLHSAPGEYTISINTINSIHSIAYCHLIDRLAGRDIDLLRQHAYTFTSNGNDGDRLLVRLRPASEDGIFAYQNGNSIVVNGEGELQVFDVTGRLLSSVRLDGTLSADRASLGILRSGVYLLRLLGNDMKTQKIVVK